MSRKKSIGLYLTIITAVLAIAGVAAYVVNSGTNYYAKNGLSMVVVGAAVVAVVLMVVEIVVGMKATPAWADALPVVSTVLLVVGLVMLLNERINALAAVFTFENTAANMADTKSCIVAIACMAIAMIFGMISSFFDITKEA